MVVLIRFACDVYKRPMNRLKYTLILVFILTAGLFAQQDTTISQAFKDSRPRRHIYFKAKYPSYSLLAGYLLVTEANRGDPFAQHELGLRYLTGQGFAPDTVKAIYWIRKAVDQNLPAARYTSQRNWSSMEPVRSIHEF